MKRFMQMLLASFGVLALMLAGCNSAPATDSAAEPSATVTPSAEEPKATGSDSIDLGVTVLPSADTTESK